MEVNVCNERNVCLKSMSHALNNAITVLGIPIQFMSIATIKLRDLIIVGINGRQDWIGCVFVVVVFGGYEVTMRTESMSSFFFFFYCW